MRLSDQAIRGLCHLLMAAELHGSWPALIRTILVVLIPKADGRRRPIGLLPILIRIWMRARGPLVRSWRSALNKVYLDGGDGKGAQRAAWMQAAKAEAARQAKRCYGIVFVDLVKAFEKMPHHLLAEAAARCGYPLWVLRLSLDTYRMERRVVIDGVCSRAILAAQGITAGSGFATIELCCLLLDVMDDLKQQLPKAACSLYVDDGTIDAEGTRQDVAGMLKCATHILVEGMKKVGLQLSSTKSVLLATCKAVARKSLKPPGPRRADC